MPGALPRTAKPVGGSTKRVIDLAISLSALFLIAPLLVLIAFLVKTTLGAPVLFRQKRVGYNGHMFECLKFRTMVLNSDEVLENYLRSNPDAHVEWKLFRKLKNDPRVTMLGRALRRSSLDELPQLFNVLKGEMSCVGPRPVMQEELSNYGQHAPDYLRARPGLTGAWQVNGRNNLSYPERVALDYAYVQTWSLWADVRILFRTIIVIARSTGSY